MTIQQITKDAEEKYPLINIHESGWNLQRVSNWNDAVRLECEAYIAGATEYTSKVEELTTDLQKREKEVAFLNEKINELTGIGSSLREMLKQRIARANHGMEIKMELQEPTFDGMNYENLFGMKKAYGDILVWLNSKEI